MESRLLYGFEIGEADSPLTHLAHVCCATRLSDASISLACELLILCTREYPLLKLSPRLLAACALYLALKAAPHLGGEQGWDIDLAAQCGFPSAVVVEQVHVHFAFLRGVEVSCRSLASARRERTLRVHLSDETFSDMHAEAMGGARPGGPLDAHHTGLHAGTLARAMH